MAIPSILSNIAAVEKLSKELAEKAGGNSNGNLMSRVGPMMDIGKEARAQLKTRKVAFDGRMLIVGCGAVAQNLLPMIPRLIDVSWSSVTVIDVFDMSSKIESFIEAGVTFVVEKVNRETIPTILAKYLGPGDILVDLAWEIPTIWCRDHDVLFINAALEVDDPYQNTRTTNIRKFTLYDRHMTLEEHLEEWGHANGPTAVIEHGANPGLVSHFVKQGLVHIAEKVLTERHDLETPERLDDIKRYLETRNWPRLAMVLGVKVIHISERDTQLSSRPKQVNEFVNTWSPMGFYQEGIAPAELGWGTHEEEFPTNAVEHQTGLKHQICLRTKGINTYVRTWVPTPNDSGNTIGMVVRHGEAYTIPQFLSVYDRKGNPIYRPTCHYSYCPSDAAISSLYELRMRGYKIQPKLRVLKDEVVSGADILGVLLMGHDFKSWWIGSCLDIEEARELVPGQNATTVQVAIGLAAAIQWMIENPRQGVCIPDELPYDQILDESLPYLGPFLSIPVDWTPLQGIREEAQRDYKGRLIPDEEDAWQFSSFHLDSTM